MPIRKQGRLGCENCRTRRIKCNRLRPRCSQCARAGLTCSGYRDPVDLQFQDETDCTTQKYQSVGGQVDAQGWQPPGRSASPTCIVPRVPVEEIAWWYYFENFNIVRTSGAPVHRPYPSRASIVIPSVTSVGLAALALVHGDPQLMELAREKYSLTIKNLMRAINNPHELRQVRTALTSFNMSMFEMIVYDQLRPASNGWLRHIHGTTALLQSVRLTEEASTADIKGLLQIGYTSALACLISGIPVPSYLPELLRNGGNITGAELLSPLIDLFSILCKLVNLYCQSYRSPGIIHSHHLLTTSVETDQELESWLSTLPTWWIDPIQTGEAPRLDDECWIMRVWVYYRVCRILGHMVIIHRIASIRTTRAHQQENQYRESVAAISRASEELYRGVPALLGASNISNRSTPALTSNAFFLITVLQTMGALTAKGSALENWLEHATQAFGEDFGVTQSLILRRLQ